MAQIPNRPARSSLGHCFEAVFRVLPCALPTLLTRRPPWSRYSPCLQISCIDLHTHRTLVQPPGPVQIGEHSSAEQCNTGVPHWAPAPASRPPGTAPPSSIVICSRFRYPRLHGPCPGLWYTRNIGNQLAASLLLALHRYTLFTGCPVEGRPPSDRPEDTPAT
jgi:hypothetical protein